jgi:hypothetical protein
MVSWQPMPSEQTNVATRRKWRELGFFYDRDDIEKRWRIVGTRGGLSRFCDELVAFAGNSKNEAKSEHVHLGPYMYLELGSWPYPQITDHWIAGPLSTLRGLADVIRLKLASAAVGDVISFRDVFAPGSPYDLILELRSDGFDPAKEDSACW